MIDYDLTKIRAFAFDVDGVLSTNHVYLFGEDGQPHRTAHIKDGYALQLAVRQRYLGLGIHHVFMGASIKIEVFDEWLAMTGLQADEVLYMGDDIPDYEVMQAVGCPCCPADAAEEIKAVSCYVSPRAGGEGCVRDVLEQVLRAQGRWMANAEAFGW